jgi:protease-4
MVDAENDSSTASSDGGLSERLGDSSEGVPRKVADDVRRAFGALTQSYILLIIVGILIGFQVAPYVTSITSEEPAQPRVAVISLSGSIDGQTASQVVNQIERARADPRVEAMVLRVNSPGGGASASEQLYLTVARAAADMPVVVSVSSFAASGAYYASLPADYIYTKPSSLVGSVGVVFVAPTEIAPLERVVVTGPSKLSGGDLQSWYYKIDAAKQAFLGAVMAQRGDELSISREKVATAQLFSGAQSVQMGIADEIGGLQTAIEDAAERADLESYGVTTHQVEGATFVTRTAYTASPLTEKRLLSPAYLVGNGTGATGPHILLLAPSVAMQAFEDQAVTALNITTNGTVTNETAALAPPLGGEIDA